MAKIQSYFSLFTVYFLLLNIILKAQTDSAKIYIISDVVVTATRTNTPILESASTITVIDSAEIERRKKNTVLDLLKTEPGVSLTQQGAFGSFANVFTRGANPGHTLVMMDGIEINMPNDPGGSFDFGNLPTDNIKRIEILRGPQSTLYGSDAMAGVINIISHKGNGKPRFFFSAEGGSYNSYRGSLGLSGSSGLFNYSLSLSRFKTDGFSSASEETGNKEKDGASNYNVSSRIGAEITDDLDLSFIFRFTKADVDYDQFGGQFGDDPTYIFNLEESAFRTEVKYLFNGIWETIAGISLFRNIRKYSNDAFVYDASKAFYDGRKLKLDWQNNFYLSAANTLTLGAETEEERAQSEYYVLSATFPFQDILPDTSLRTTGVYIQDKFRLGNFFGTLGIRYDDHEKFGSSVTYKIAPAVFLWKSGIKLKATAGTGFKAPSLYYLFDPSYGNPDLNPEKSFGWDAGIEQYFANAGFSAGLTYFRNYLTDLFGFDENFKTINIDKAESYGIEFYLTSNPVRELQIKSGFTYTKTKNTSDDSPDKNLALIRRPEIKSSISINYAAVESLNLNLEIIYVSRRDDMDFSALPAIRVKLDSYTLFNLSASYDLFEFLQLYGRVENLFDTGYQEVLGYATPGLSGYAGVKCSF